MSIVIRDPCHDISPDGQSRSFVSATSNRRYFRKVPSESTDRPGYALQRSESSSMRTSKNRSSRARYTCAGWATGRSGRVAVLLCFISLFCSVLLFLHPLPSSFHLPAYRARSPFLPVAVRASLSPAAAHSRELLFDCFITFINTAATMLPLLLLLLLALVAARRAFPLLVRGAHCCSRKRCEF